MSNSSKRPSYFLGLDVEKNRTPLVLFGIIVGLWSLCWILVTNLVSDPDPANSWSMRGQFGDMFGAVNALFSGLAFSGIILTILLQREELRAQREELQLNTAALNAQRDELSAQRHEFEQQNATLKRQNFENTFFNSLIGKDGIVSNLNQRESKGNFFEVMYQRLDGAYRRADDSPPNLEALRQFFYNNEWLLGHYFRTVVIILKLIDNVNGELDSFYVSVAQARMSNDELRLFLYYVTYELNNSDDQPGTITFKERTELQSLIRRFDFFSAVRTRTAVNLINPKYDWEILRKLTHENLP